MKKVDCANYGRRLLKLLTGPGAGREESGTDNARLFALFVLNQAVKFSHPALPAAPCFLTASSVR
jgi:hypothetical protein